jgi:cytochrome c-type biogenesis protein CcmE
MIRSARSAKPLEIAQAIRTRAPRRCRLPWKEPDPQALATCNAPPTLRRTKFRKQLGKQLRKQQDEAGSTRHNLDRRVWGLADSASPTKRNGMAMTKGVQLALGATVIAGLLGWLGFTNLQEASTFQYYQSLEEFLEQARASSELEGKSLRLHGYVALESIDRDLGAKQVRFRVQNDPPHKVKTLQPTLAVLFHGLETPDLFQDGAEVVVEGTIARSGDQLQFHAQNVLAKCPSKFEAKKEQLETQSVSL